MKLCVLDGPLADHEFPITSFPVTLGRSRSASDIGLSADTRLSRCHCRISLSLDGLWVEDLSSSNGTWIDDRAVTERKEIKRGQIFRIGDTSVCIVDDEETVPQTRQGNGWTSIDLATGETELSSAADDSFRTRPVSLRALAFDTEVDPELSVTEPHEIVSTAVQPIASASSSEGEIQRLRHSVTILQRLSGELTRTVDLGQIFRVVAESIVQACAGARVVVLLPGEDGQLLPALAYPESRAKEKLILSRTIVDRAVKDRLTVVIEDTASDELLASSQSIQAALIRSALCIPLLIVDSVRAVLYVDAGMPRAFPKDETDMVIAIGNQAALALSNAGQSERLLSVSERLRDAKKKQENLLEAFKGMVRTGV